MTGTIYRDGLSYGKWLSVQPGTPERVHLRAQFAARFPHLAKGEPFVEGRAAKASGIPFTACPYDTFSLEAEDWMRGWRGEASKYSHDPQHERAQGPSAPCMARAA